MTVTMRKGWLWAGIAAVPVLALGYAWVDGGREPMRVIADPIPVPKAPQ